jgi:hypothetical protein
MVKRCRRLKNAGPPAPASSPPDYNNLQMPSCHSAQAARINLNRVTVVSVERITIIITPHSLFLSILATMFVHVATGENIARLDVVCLDHTITLSPPQLDDLILVPIAPVLLEYRSQSFVLFESYSCLPRPHYSLFDLTFLECIAVHIGHTPPPTSPHRLSNPMRHHPVAPPPTPPDLVDVPVAPAPL